METPGPGPGRHPEACQRPGGPRAPLLKSNISFLFPSVTTEQDDKYWARRRKNNMAAKRSRDARRLKENQIAIRASFLEKENSALRQEVADLRKELGKCKNILAKYEARHGPL